jgi:hypothetical protein
VAAPGGNGLPNGYTVIRGHVIGGGLLDLFDSDDSRLEVNAGLTLTPIEPEAWLEVTTDTTTATPSELRFVLEARVNTPNVEQRIALYNYNTLSYEQLDVRPATTSDSVVTIVVSTNASRFVDPATLEMKARLQWKTVGLTGLFPWTVGIDQSIWEITP